MVLPALVRQQVKLLLKELCAFDAVVRAEGGAVLVGDQGAVEFELARVAEVAVDEVEVAGAALGFAAADGAHGV